MPKNSDRVLLLEQFGTIIKRLILDGKEDSEDFKEIVELNNVLFRPRPRLFLILFGICPMISSASSQG